MSFPKNSRGLTPPHTVRNSYWSSVGDAVRNVLQDISERRKHSQRVMADWQREWMILE